MAVSAMPQSQLRSVGIENRDAAISQVTGLAPPSPESMDDETMHAMDSIMSATAQASNALNYTDFVTTATITSPSDCRIILVMVAAAVSIGAL
jgi:hypothetical protein